MIMLSQVIACLDVYEATADLSYFRFAQKIADAMIAGFHDQTGGGFFRYSPHRHRKNGSLVLGALTASRKPLQDSPTPAGNPAAAIALLRLHSWTNNARYRELAEDALEAFAGIVEHYGLFASTYALALDLYLNQHTQVVIIGSGPAGRQSLSVSRTAILVSQSVLRLPQVEARNLPPALAETVPNLPGAATGVVMAVVCSGFTCQPPVSDAASLGRMLRETLGASQNPGGL